MVAVEMACVWVSGGFLFGESEKRRRIRENKRRDSGRIGKG